MRAAMAGVDALQSLIATYPPLVQAWIAGGRLSFGIGAWILHLAVLGLAALLFWRRMTLPRWSLRRLVLRA